MSTDEPRRSELEDALAAVRGRVATAAEAAGRDLGEVHLVAVTKNFPASDIELLDRLGIREIGESKDQEAAAKVAELEAMTRQRLTVHFVGQLQTNKARSVARYADVVHSVDRPRLVGALDRAAGAALDAGERTAFLDVLIQVDLGEGEWAGRGGTTPGTVPSLTDQVLAGEHLRLRGVMAVAPRGLDDAGLLAAFGRLAEIAATVREQVPGASWISAGMSADLEQAVAAGATHLRVGSAILGSRGPAR